eukprot:TRINITY_DN294_c0_g1_i1.p1 TRINITY_DN294_c0_g1~~TRINITY_DN294_c0_g1_i1.p1  ORF type:complete len:252 (+),score=51.35 TRINITY_DN294_c0_g1_i1:197-952(+)
MATNTPSDVPSIELQNQAVNLDSKLTPKQLMLYAAAIGDEGLLREANSRGANPNTNDEPTEEEKKLQEEEQANSKEKEKGEGEEKEDDDKMIYKTTVVAGDYPLHIVAENGFLKCIQFLVSMNAQLENKNRLGSTALHRAVSMNQADCVQFLVSHRADISATNLIGNTPLHVAAYSGHDKIVDFLLRNGASKDVNTRNKINLTPLDYARKTLIQNSLKQHMSDSMLSSSSASSSTSSVVSSSSNISLLSSN